MCLYVYDYCEITTAEEEITFYKRFDVSADQLLSPYQRYHYTTKEPPEIPLVIELWDQLIKAPTLEAERPILEKLRQLHNLEK